MEDYDRQQAEKWGQPPPDYQPPPVPTPPRTGVVALVIGVSFVVFVVFMCAIVGSCITTTTSTQNTNTTATQVGATTATQVAQDTQATQNAQPTNTPQPTNTAQPTDTPQPTAKPQPTQSPAQIEKAYKSTTTSTTVADVDKNGNQWQYKNVHFTCTIIGFVKDDSGNTAGANVDDPNTSGVAQIIFPDGTDLSRLNTGDTMEVWGIDAGVFSGQNAFGGTVQEVGVTALYMTDQTTGYSTK